MNAVIRSYESGDKTKLLSGLQNTCRLFEENSMLTPFVVPHFYAQCREESNYHDKAKSVLGFRNFEEEDYFVQAYVLAKNEGIFNKLREGQPITDD